MSRIVRTVGDHRRTVTHPQVARQLHGDQRGIVPIIILDDAQALRDEVLHELRTNSILSPPSTSTTASTSPC